MRFHGSVYIDHLFYAVPNAVDCQEYAAYYTLRESIVESAPFITPKYSWSTKYSRSTSDYSGVLRSIGVIRSNSEFFRSTEKYSGITPEYCGVQKSTSEYGGVLLSDSLSCRSRVVAAFRHKTRS